MLDHTRTVVERRRFPAPAPKPQAIAFDGTTLWISSWEPGRLYGVDATDGRTYEEFDAPGKPVGGVAIGADLRFVLSEGDDARFIRAFASEDGFASEALPCPDDTGSFLAYDGASLWLSQRRLKRIHELDARAKIVRTIDVGEQIVGFTRVGALFYFALWLGKERGAAIGSLGAGEVEPALRIRARSPFVAVGLAHDGDVFWTNDHFANETVAFSLSEP